MKRVFVILAAILGLVVVGILCILLAVEIPAFNVVGRFGLLCWLAAFVLVLYGLIAWSGAADRNAAQAAENLKSKGYKYVAAARDGSAIGLNAEQRRLFLRNARKQSKEYAFEEVRSWRVHFQETGKSYVASSPGFANGVAALSTQRAINRENRRIDSNSNGLFVMVKDIDAPEWHIGLQSTSDQSKWHEILTQYLNEGATA